jgi:palmitoyltransferase
MRKIIGYFFIAALFSILALIYYTFYWKLFFPRYLKEPSVKWILIVGHFLFFMEIWCLVSVIFSEPGKVPPYWVISNQGFYQTNEESRQKRYCMLCHVFKPERCHHCSVCNRCVLNMDHHCPWINNCVGFSNRKTFILLLLYSLANLYFIFLFFLPMILETFQTILVIFT